jgi:hypothetical protein
MFVSSPVVHLVVVVAILAIATRIGGLKLAIWRTGSRWSGRRRRDLAGGACPEIVGVVFEALDGP